MKGFTSCGRNLGVEADIICPQVLRTPARQVPGCSSRGQDCHLPVDTGPSDRIKTSHLSPVLPIARITEGVVKDEYTHLNYGQEWLKANFEDSKESYLVIRPTFH